MSSNSIPRPSHGAPPLVALATWLENAQNRDDKVVSFPANTSKIIVTGAQHDMWEVQAIVLALEYRDSIICERLDSLGLTILCSIFIHSQECIAQQRGLCLLAKALHPNKLDSAQKAAHKQGKKMAMGQAALTLLIKGFLKTDFSHMLRRWLGILALELLEDCPENTEKLQSDPPKEKHWQYLSEVIEHGNCQVLKLLAGSMIREMLSFGVSPDDFWPTETGMDLYSRFPKSQHHDTQWVTSFEEFVDELVLGKILRQEVSSVMFAHAVYVGDRKWDLEEASDILVTISKELNIIVPADDANLAVYIDVPLNSILEVSFDKELVTDSQKPTYGLIIQLMSGAATNCILNATGHAERYVALAFASEKDAKTLRRLLVPMNARTNGFSPQSQSGAVDVSEPILSDDDLAAPGSPLSDNRILTRTASLAGAIIPHRHAVSIINPSRLGRVRTSQPASAEHQEGSSSSMVEHDEDPQGVGHIVEMAAEGIDVSQKDSLVEQANEGIDVSENDCLSHQESRHQDIQARVPNNALSNARVRYSQAFSNRTQEPMGHVERASDTELSSSLGWQTGLNAIQNAPEFDARLPQQAVSSVEQLENKEEPKSQDGEHDDLYDASPKVKDGRRRSPRIAARENTPKDLERPLETIARQPSVKTGPPIKLSRQLRNADGVVESRTERTADDGLATSTKDNASDFKTSANSKRSKAPAPAKVKTVTSTKPTKKKAQSKGKAIATEKPPNDSFDNYDLLPSPTRAASTIQTSGNKKKATITQPKATKVPRNNPKQAKPVPTKAASTISSKGPAIQLTQDFKKKAVGNGSIQRSVSNRPSGKKTDGDDDAIWDVDKAHSEERPQSLGRSRQAAKAIKKQEVHASKTEKTKAQTKAPTTRPVTAKPAPTALSQPRTRRIAAVKANKKIQGLDESDEIVDDDEVMLLPKASDQNAISRAAKASITQKIRGSNDGRPTSGGKLLTQKPSIENSIPDSISPDSSEEQPKKTQIPESVLEPKANSSREIVNLVKDAPAEILLREPDDASDNLPKENPITAPEYSVASLHSDHGKLSSQPKCKPLEESVEVNIAKVDLVPNSVPKLQQNINDTEPTRAHQDRDVGDPGAMDLAGSGDQDHVEDVLPYIGDVSLQSKTQADRVEKEVSAPPAPMGVENRQRRTSPRLAEAAQRALAKSTTTRGDPFAAKLNASMLKSRDINARVKTRGVPGDVNVESKGPNTPEPAKLARPLREPKARVVDKLGATSFEDTKQVENPRRHLESAMHLEGEGEDSLIETLKPAGGSTPASGVETKRRIEQLGDTSHKRVKLAPREQLEGVSTRRKPAYKAKKTPPPVVSNRPVVIGFSTTGPRNQGTTSTEKPTTPKNVGPGAPGAVELHKHEMRNQVEAGFASVQETLQIPSEDIKYDLKNASGAQTKARGPPQREQSEHLRTVIAVATREANTQEHRAQKRKLAPFVDDPAPWEHEQLPKRQKRDIETPPTAHNHHPKMLPAPSPAMIHDRSQRLSSQNTRVNENGSPMPFLIARNEHIAAEEQYLDEDDGMDALAEARLEEQLLLQDDEPMLPEPMLPLRPLPSVVSISQPKTAAYKSLSNNSKQVPSSPHAPSAFGTMPPHHIYHDGEIVNAETKESIIPVKPQDPFLSATQNPRNSFMNALRKSTEVAAKRLVSGANDKRGLGGMVARPSLKVGEDPEKTLVEPNLKKRYKQVLVSDSSSSSQSDSPTQVSQLDESSEEESDAETEAKWRRKLEPHQENMLQCLLTISHRLVRHLVDKETAIKDVVADFASHGNSLVEAYEKGRQDSIDSRKSNKERRYQNLVKTFAKAQADQATTSKGVVKRHVEDMKAQWERQQKVLMDNMAAALAACTD